MLHRTHPHQRKKRERTSPKALLVTSMSHMPGNIFTPAIDNVVFLTLPSCFTVSTQYLFLWLFFFFLIEVIPLLEPCYGPGQQKKWFHRSRKEPVLPLAAHLAVGQILLGELFQANTKPVRKREKSKPSV